MTAPPAGERRCAILAPLITGEVLLLGLMGWFAAHAEAITPWFLTPLTAALAGALGALLALPRWSGTGVVILHAAGGLLWVAGWLGPLLRRHATDTLGAEWAALLADPAVLAAELLVQLVWAFDALLARSGFAADAPGPLLLLLSAIWPLAGILGWWIVRGHHSLIPLLLPLSIIISRSASIKPTPAAGLLAALACALLILAWQHTYHLAGWWRARGAVLPRGAAWRSTAGALLALALTVPPALLVPDDIARQPVERWWRQAALEGDAWLGQAQRTLAERLSTGGTRFPRHTAQVGGARARSDTPLFRISGATGEYLRVAAFDRYTGRGWSSTTGERARLAAGPRWSWLELDADEPLGGAPLTGHLPVTSIIEPLQAPADDLLPVPGWFRSSSLPVAIEIGMVAAMPDARYVPLDIASVAARQRLGGVVRYQIVSEVSVASPEQLRQAGSTYPEWLRDSALALPPTLPARVAALAQQLTATAATPYDAALAIEQHLRGRLRYDDQRPAPPADVDWVDHVLFSADAGYCDDFAAAMVVLLRTQGIPARFVQGYAPGEPADDGRTALVRADRAHSWPEVYFPGFGWQRFEPTAAGYLPPAAAPPTTPTPTAPPAATPTPAAAPPTTPTPATPPAAGPTPDAPAPAAAPTAPGAPSAWHLLASALWLGVALTLALAALALGRWHDRRQHSLAIREYRSMGWLARLGGLPLAASDTPLEFAQRLAAAVPDQRAAVLQVAARYSAERYGSDPVPDIPQLVPWQLAAALVRRRFAVEWARRHVPRRGALR
ncbi:MAG: transglutaminase-like domain-containing protein [Chloroflexi bacterium]|nr:transglutaminase-like domain-containing protein [Chloroflexota bacterium]